MSIAAVKSNCAPLAVWKSHGAIKTFLSFLTDWHKSVHSRPIDLLKLLDSIWSGELLLVLCVPCAMENVR